MAGEGSETIDFWGVLEEAEQTVEGWPSWQQQYEADVFRQPDPPVELNGE